MYMIRSADQRDEAVITQLTIDGRMDNYLLLLEESYIQDFMTHNTTEKTRNRLVERMSRVGAVCLVYERAGEVLGYIFGNTIEQRITHLFVRADARGQGIGHALLNEFLEKTSVATWTIEVVAKNERAIELYKVYHFSQVGVKPQTYFGLEKIIMRRRN